MRHRKSGRQLNRNASHRNAMFRNMAVSLLKHEQIKTTVPKAKELRRVIEPIITLAKTASVSNKRLAFARLRDREMVIKLFAEIGPHFASRPGGYTRILKAGSRVSDNAPMAYMQLVDRDIMAAKGLDVDDDEEFEAPIELESDATEDSEENEAKAKPKAKKAKAKT